MAIGGPLGLKAAAAMLVGVLTVMFGLDGYVSSVMQPLADADSFAIIYGPKRDIVVEVNEADFSEWAHQAYPSNGEACGKYCFRTVGVRIGANGTSYEGTMCSMHGLEFLAGESVVRFRMPTEFARACFTLDALDRFRLAPDHQRTEAIFQPEYLHKAEVVYALIQSEILFNGAPVGVVAHGPHLFVVEFDYIIFGDPHGPLHYRVNTDTGVVENISRARCGNI